MLSITKEMNVDAWVVLSNAVEELIETNYVGSEYEDERKKMRDAVDRMYLECADPDTISLGWGLEDVYYQADQSEIELTEQEARDILSLMDSKHDATIGMSWDVIDVWIDHVVAERKS